MKTSNNDIENQKIRRKSFVINTFLLKKKNVGPLTRSQIHPQK